MKSFPFDSEVTYDELGNPSFDRGVDSGILSDFLHLMFNDGVFPNPSTGLQVISSENDMSVVVLPGNCMIQGRMGIEQNERELVFEASGTSYDRIDSVVVRLNTNYDYRDIDLYVVKGTEASAPVAPDLTRTGGVYELRLANVFIAKNTTVVSSERITDTRLTSECGIVTSNPATVDTSSIFNQYQSALNKYLVYVQECIDGTTAGNLQNQIDELKEDTLNQLNVYGLGNNAAIVKAENGMAVFGSDGTTLKQMSASNFYTPSCDLNSVNIKSDETIDKLNIVEKFSISSVEKNGYCENALLVSTQANSDVNKPQLVAKDITTNIPSNFMLGFRKVVIVSGSHYYVELTGIDSNLQPKKWLNFFNVSTWSGWKEVTPATYTLDGNTLYINTQ